MFVELYIFIYLLSNRLTFNWRERKRISFMFVRSFLFSFCFLHTYKYTSVPIYIYIYTCMSYNRTFHFSHGQSVAAGEYEYITQMEEQTTRSFVIWSKLTYFFCYILNCFVFIRRRFVSLTNVCHISKMKMSNCTNVLISLRLW